MSIVTELKYTANLDKGVCMTPITPSFMGGDQEAHRITVDCYRQNSREPVDLSGAGVTAYFVRADGMTIPLVGETNGSKASVLLPAACYAVMGRFSLVIKLSLDDGAADSISTVFWGEGAVSRSRTDVVIDPDSVIPSLEELLAQIAAMEIATNNANTAAGNANQAAADALKNVDEAVARQDEVISQLSSDVADASAINDGAITPPKTSFFETVEVKPINLLDESKMTLGKYVNSSGGLSDNANYNVTDYIPVSVGDVIRLQASFVTGGARFDLETMPNYGSLRYCALYDKDKNYIPGSRVDNVPTLHVADATAVYCRVCLDTRYVMTYADKMIFASESAAILPYSPYFEPYTTYKLVAEYAPAEKVTAFLPPEICIAEGRTIELYKNQILPNAGKYHLKWDTKYSSAARGRAFERKASFYGRTGWAAERDAAPIALTVYNDDMQALWSGGTTIKYALGLSSPKAICFIGDSLTNNKAWLAEIINLSGGNLSLVGTRPFSVADADGNTRTGFHEGRSGWTAEMYNQPGAVTPDESTYQYANPFYNSDAGHFDWSYYVSNSLGGVSPDAVMLWLGTNGIALDPTVNAGAIKTLVDYIRADDANIPIFLAYTIYPGNQDALGSQTSSDGYAAKSGAWQYEEYKKVLNLCIKLTELMGDYENLHFVPLATCHDSEYNYGAVETPVNPRAAQTVEMPIEAVHPQAQGYYQIADVVFSSLSVHLGE